MILLSPRPGLGGSTGQVLPGAPCLAFETWVYTAAQAHGTGSAITKPATSISDHFQLLPPATVAAFGLGAESLRTVPRIHASSVRFCRRRLSRDGRARPHAGERAKAGGPEQGHPGPQTLRVGSIETPSILAGAILRLQRIHIPQGQGEDPVHAPKSGRPRPCTRGRRVAMVELSPLRNGRGLHR